MSLLELIASARAHMDPREADFFVARKPDLDGSTATMCALISEEKNSEMKFLGYDQRSPLDITELLGKKVIFAGCAPTPEQYDAIVLEGGKVLVLDYHLPAMEKLENKPGCFCMPKELGESGASMVHAYFNPTKEISYLVELVKNHTLYTGENPESEYFFAGVNDAHNPLSPGDLIQYQIEANLRRVIDRGREIVETENKEVEELAGTAVRGTLTCPDSTEVMAIIAEISSWKLASKLGKRLYKEYPEDAVILYHPVIVKDKPAFKWYLRSDPSHVDSNVIASKFVYDGLPGGGQKDSAGAVWPTSPEELFEARKTHKCR